MPVTPFPTWFLSTKLERSFTLDIPLLATLRRTLTHSSMTELFQLTLFMLGTVVMAALLPPSRVNATLARICKIMMSVNSAMTTVSVPTRVNSFALLTPRRLRKNLRKKRSYWLVINKQLKSSRNSRKVLLRWFRMRCLWRTLKSYSVLSLSSWRKVFTTPKLTRLTLPLESTPSPWEITYGPRRTS